jgi:hypothetical protein
MTRETWSHIGTSRHTVSGYTGFAGVAEHLNTTYEPAVAITRQLVYTWYARRARTGFPEKRTIPSGSRTLELFDLTQVDAWYLQHRTGSLVG